MIAYVSHLDQYVLDIVLHADTPLLHVWRAQIRIRHADGRGRVEVIVVLLLPRDLVFRRRDFWQSAANPAGQTGSRGLTGKTTVGK